MSIQKLLKMDLISAKGTTKEADQKVLEEKNQNKKPQSIEKSGPPPIPKSKKSGLLQYQNLRKVDRLQYQNLRKVDPSTTQKEKWASAPTKIKKKWTASTSEKEKWTSAPTKKIIVNIFLNIVMFYLTFISLNKHYLYTLLEFDIISSLLFTNILK